MANVVIDDKHLYDIGDALRSKLGNTRKEIVTQTVHYPAGMYDMEKIIVKTSNATGFNNFEGSYANSMNDYQVVSVPGAAKLKVIYTYQTENAAYDYLQVVSGDKTGQTMPSEPKWGGTTLTKRTETWVTDTITFHFHSDGSGGNYLGYYAEVTPLDANGNVLQEYKEAWDAEEENEVEVPNVFKPRDMATAIDSIEAKGSGFAVVGSPIITRTASSASVTTQLVPLNDKNSAYILMELRSIGEFYTRSYNGIDSSLCVSKYLDNNSNVVFIPSTAITSTTSTSSITTQSTNLTGRYSTHGLITIRNIDMSDFYLANFSAKVTNGKIATINNLNAYEGYKKIIVISDGFVYNDASLVNTKAFYPQEENGGFKRVAGTVTAAASGSSYYTGAGTVVLEQDAETTLDAITVNCPQYYSDLRLEGFVLFYKTPEEV